MPTRTRPAPGVAARARQAVSRASAGLLCACLLLPGSAAPQSSALQVFQVASSLKVGNRGEEVYELSVPAPACGRPALVFDHARLVVERRRFGDAAIVAAPPAGCTTCPPLRVRWYHEPTGLIEFQVHVVRRRVEAPCPDRGR